MSNRSEGGSAADRKRAEEFRYWNERKAAEGTLHNGWYQYFYTEHFGLNLGDYAGIRVLDIGCGPRGSLDWARDAAERVGLDPLADDYRRLRPDGYLMEMVASGSEDIPYADGHFDIVCSFNSLDHVDDLDETVAEIKRVARPGGLFLLLTDVNHKATECSPSRSVGRSPRCSPMSSRSWRSGASRSRIPECIRASGRTSPTTWTIRPSGTGSSR